MSRYSIQHVAEWLREHAFVEEEKPSRERMEAAVRGWCAAENCEPQDLVEIAATRIFEDEVEPHLPARKPGRKER